MNRIYKAVIFDLDGTLLDTLEDIAESMNIVLRKRGLPIHDVDTYKGFIGHGLRFFVSRAIPNEKQDSRLIDECMEDFNMVYGLNFNSFTKPYDGIPALLDNLTRLDITMSVLSNKPDDLTIRCINELLTEWKFKKIIGQRNGIPHKPDPSGALHIAEFTGIPTRETIFLGDSAVDMQTGTAAGMFPVGALWGFGERGELMDGGAKILIEEPRELLELLD